MLQHCCYSTCAMAHACNRKTREAETGGPGVGGAPKQTVISVIPITQKPLWNLFSTRLRHQRSLGICLCGKVSWNAFFSIRAYSINMLKNSHYWFLTSEYYFILGYSIEIRWKSILYFRCIVFLSNNKL